MIFNPIPFGTQAPLRHSKTYHSDSLAHTLDFDAILGTQGLSLTDRKIADIEA